MTDQQFAERLAAGFFLIDIQLQIQSVSLALSGRYADKYFAPKECVRSRWYK
jgi:hypothetical protein